jgi:hypothetical protein
MKKQIRISFTIPPLARLSKKAETLSRYQLIASIIGRRSPC